MKAAHALLIYAALSLLSSSCVRANSDRKLLIEGSSRRLNGPKKSPEPVLDKSKCLNTPNGQLMPQGGRVVITLKGKGHRTFWCNGGELEYAGNGNLHGDSIAKLVSTDGAWTGEFHYRLADGLPQWTIMNKKSGTKRIIVAEEAPKARKDAPNGAPLTWDRRKVISSQGPPPKVSWVVRTNTTSGKLPKTCHNDLDVIVPFTAVYDFIVC